MVDEVGAEVQETPPFERFLKIYRRFEVVFEEGTSGREMYLIHSGGVSLMVGKAGGNESKVAVLKPGDFFGEMSLVDYSQRSATAVAIEDNTQLIVLDRPKFMFLVQQNPQFALTIMHNLCQRLRELDKRLKGGAE
ncbi:MAG: cyclic nucleotide-binding domain-containing protein [Dehalococcoidia bacterium]|nr:cyclic nucleotide-binding domain-containing protein [Dehalococcoidia bacterium]